MDNSACLVRIFSPVRILVNYDLETILDPWSSRLQLLCLILPLHLSQQATILCLFQGILDVECATYARVSNDRGENVRAVDRFALP